MVRKGKGHRHGSSRALVWKAQPTDEDKVPAHAGEKFTVVGRSCAGLSSDQSPQPVLKIPSPAAVSAKESEPLSAQATYHEFVQDGIVAPKDLSPNKKAFANSSTGNGSKLMEGRAIANSKAINETEEVMGCEKLVRLAIAAGEQQGLSETDLEQNAQQQKDEILALQSIFETDFIPVDEVEGRPSAFMINVHVELPSSISVVADAPSCSELQDNSSVTSTSGSFSFTIQHLPPICLLCVLPATYPSHSPPLFTLSCLWLSPLKLSSLCASLDKIAVDYSPEVVVYTWADWLRTDSLSHLGICEKLELGPYHERGMEKNINDYADDRALSSSTSFDVDIARILRHNEERQNKEFLRSLHMCNICLTEHTGKDFARMPCQHMFCWACMQQLSDMQVKEGTVINLTCPDTSCREPIPPGLLKDLLGPEAFQRWEDLTLQRTLDSMTDIVYCPRCKNVGIEDQDHHVQCSNCFFSFCSLCFSSWHVGAICMTPEARLRILQSRQKGRVLGEEQSRKEKDLINQVLNMKYIGTEAKQCPTCKMAVTKSEGCNKMTCSNCGNYFCFKCGHSIPGYEHFRDGSCVLFNQEEIDQWEQRFNLQLAQHHQQQAFNQAGGQLGGVAGYRPCPNCRQPNFKEGNNNHILCWACQNHYCALCHTMVRRSSDHYGPNKCRQHTPD
ncbi:unnamed protein product [Sphagnum tenellum]